MAEIKWVHQSSEAFLGLVEVGVAYRTAGSRINAESHFVSPVEWQTGRDGVLRRIAAMLDKAMDAAGEEQRQALYSAGPKGTLP